MAMSFWLAFIICRDVILLFILFFLLIITLLYRIWPQYFSVAHFYMKLDF